MANLLTPEYAVEIQRQLGADLIVVLDECTPFHVDKSYTEQSMLRSHRWATRCLTEFQRTDTGKQALYGIIQGGVYSDLRQTGCEFVNAQPFFGHAIGGSLGADKTQMQTIVAMTAERLNPERPIHLLGIGGLSDILHGVEQGIDTFDCVHPTRIARHGGALVPESLRTQANRDHINLHNAEYSHAQDPIDANCPCYTCQHFSKAYLHHLFKARELLGMSLVTLHNVTFMNRFMAEIRARIKNSVQSNTYNHASISS